MTSTDAGPFQVNHYNGSVYLGKGSIEQPDALTPDQARLLAGALIAHAGEADSEAEAGVQRLAQVLRDANPPPEEWQRTTPLIPVEAFARAILAAGYTPPERG